MGSHFWRYFLRRFIYYIHPRRFKRRCQGQDAAAVILASRSAKDSAPDAHEAASKVGNASRRSTDAGRKIRAEGRVRPAEQAALRNLQNILADYEQEAISNQT